VVYYEAASGRSGEYDIGKLPPFEYALEQAWAKGTGPRIGLAEYSGLEQALEERANANFASQAPYDRSIPFARSNLFRDLAPARTACIGLCGYGPHLDHASQFVISILAAHGSLMVKNAMLGFRANGPESVE